MVNVFFPTTSKELVSNLEYFQKTLDSIVTKYGKDTKFILAHTNSSFSYKAISNLMKLEEHYNIKNVDVRSEKKRNREIKDTKQDAYVSDFYEPGDLLYDSDKNVSLLIADPENKEDIKKMFLKGDILLYAHEQDENLLFYPGMITTIQNKNKTTETVITSGTETNNFREKLKVNKNEHTTISIPSTSCEKEPRLETDWSYFAVMNEKTITFYETAIERSKEKITTRNEWQKLRKSVGKPDYFENILENSEIQTTFEEHENYVNSLHKTWKRVVKIQEINKKRKEGGKYIITEEEASKHNEYEKHNSVKGRMIDCRQMMSETAKTKEHFKDDLEYLQKRFETLKRIDDNKNCGWEPTKIQTNYLDPVTSKWSLEKMSVGFEKTIENKQIACIEMVE